MGKLILLEANELLELNRKLTYHRCYGNLKKNLRKATAIGPIFINFCRPTNFAVDGVSNFFRNTAGCFGAFTSADSIKNAV